MERLTMRDAGGRAFWVSPNHPGGGYRLVEDSKDVMRLDRLAAYEDTGLQPEEITLEQPAWKPIFLITPVNMAMGQRILANCKIVKQRVVKRRPKGLFDVGNFGK